MKQSDNTEAPFVAIANSERLTQGQEQFALNMLTERTIQSAYMKAFPLSVGKSPGYVSTAANKLLNTPHVAARIQELRNAAAQQAIVDTAQVLREWVDIAMAEPAKIMQHRRLCCRHCHGAGFAYQWTPQEFADETARVIDNNRTRKEHNKAPLPVNAGGTWFDKVLRPNRNCPECSGEGVSDVWFADTRDLTGPEAKLFAGVKTTKNGIEVLVRSQDAALNNIAKYLGMLVDKHKLVPGDTPDGNPQDLLAALSKMLPN